MKKIQENQENLKILKDSNNMTTKDLELLLEKVKSNQQ